MTCTASRSRRLPWALAPERTRSRGRFAGPRSPTGKPAAVGLPARGASTRKRWSRAVSRTSRRSAAFPSTSHCAVAAVRTNPPTSTSPWCSHARRAATSRRASRGLRLGEDIVAVVPHGDQPQIGNWRETADLVPMTIGWAPARMDRCVL